MRGKPFADRNYINECIVEAANDLYPEKVSGFQPVQMCRKQKNFGENMVAQISQKVRNFWRCSLALDESSDLMAIHNFESLFMGFIWISMSMKSWHLLAGCREQL